MIQRIQSLWLFLAAMLNGLLFLFPLYRYNVPNPVFSPWQIEGARTYMPLFVIAAIITLLPMITIFLYGNRKRQIGLIWITVIAISSFLSVMLMRVSNLKNGTPPISNFQYMLPGVLVTLLALICMVLALRGIRHDQKLIKSMDRLR